MRVRGAGFAKVWSDVAFGAVGRTSGTDAEGFLARGALSNAPLTSRLSSAPTSDALTAEPVDASSGVWSTFLFGEASATGSRRLAFLFCLGRTDCSRLP
jgi:hypothetical protein